ncbi:MAG TPA: hypothetical protein VFY84_17515 [Jiangellales bacterium]|nr:hypothetical protein [Jiangellales bacterium]
MGAEQAGRGHPFLVRRLADPDLRAKAEAAERLGISLKRFEGWEPATFYERDEHGQLVSSVPETEWDETEQGWMLALAEYRASLCPCGCGHKAADTLAMEGTHQWRVRKVRCHARDQLAVAQNAYNGQRPEAVLWSVEKR